MWTMEHGSVKVEKKKNLKVKLAGMMIMILVMFWLKM